MYGSASLPRARKHPNLTNRVSIGIHPIEGEYSAAQKLELMKGATETVSKIVHCSPEEVVLEIVEH